MTLKKRSLIIFLITLSTLLSGTLTVRAQSSAPTPDEMFSWEDYVGALAGYLKLETKGPVDIDVKRRIGQCYLKVHDDKTKAIPYLVSFYNADKSDPEIMMELGQAYHFTNQFEKAAFFYDLYKKAVHKKNLIEKVERMIETVETAKELIKHPVPVTFEDLGKEVNTKFAEYYPFVTEDEGTLYFTSRRTECVGSEKSMYGYFSSDIFVSKVANGQWQKAKNMGPMFNGPYDEECVGISSDGKNMIVFVNHPDIGADLLHAEYAPKGKNFAKPAEFPEPVNTEYGEFEGCFTADGSAVYFASDRKGGFGEADIYCSHRLPNGDWGTPQHLGSGVNTKYIEGFPVISHDGKTLFFASQGHTNMGGFDIFKSQWDSINNKWSDAVNIGYPINTTDDDMMFSVAGNGRDGYVSQCRKDGMGDLDIYKVVFNDVEALLTAVHGKITSKDTTKMQLESTITLINLSTKQEIESKELDPERAKYVFIMEPGKYKLKVQCAGHKDLEQEFFVYDKGNYKVDVQKDFVLEPTNWKPPVEKKKTPGKK
jgi:hypothetical protein